MDGSDRWYSMWSKHYGGFDPHNYSSAVTTDVTSDI